MNAAKRIGEKTRPARPRPPADGAAPDALLDCAVAAARAAGRHALRHTKRRREVFALYRHDVKLVLDRECQAVAHGVIRRRFPDHGILGEEKLDSNRASEFLWIIDPIDGTVNFFHGLPIWCVSIAVQAQGRSAAGAVYAPELDEFYTARIGCPALCNGRPIAVSANARLNQALVSTGVGKQTRDNSSYAGLFETLGGRIQKLRILGSAALDICNVARGRTEGFFESGIFIWDAAAGSLIVEQAGGRAEILASGPGHRLALLASNGKIHERLKAIVRRALP